METAPLIALITSALALLGSLVVAYFQRRTAKETHEVASAAHIIVAYDQLCQRLRAELAAKGEEIDRLRARIAEIEKRESTWNGEKAQLELRILRLEEEREHLRQQLTDANGRGGVQ